MINKLTTLTELELYTMYKDTSQSRYQKNKITEFIIVFGY